MNVKKCENGHFYDADKYASCPHCGSASGNDGMSTGTSGYSSGGAEVKSMPEQTMGRTFGVFDEPKPVKESEYSQTAAVRPLPHEESEPASMQNNGFAPAASAVNTPARNQCPSCMKTIPENAKFCRFCGKTIPQIAAPIVQNEAPEILVAPANCANYPMPQPIVSAPMGTTCTVCGNILVSGARFCRFCGNAVNQVENVAPSATPVEYVAPVENVVPVEYAAPVMPEPQMKADVPEAVEVQQSAVVEEPVEEKPISPSLQEAIKSAVSGSEGKTVGFFSMGGKTSDNTEESSDPVVGWLVCIGGKHLGDSFNIYAGKNSIGRGVSNRIIIARDNTVSREKQLWLIYEPKKREFFVQPGEGSGLSYLNGDVIMETKKINSKDQLDIGDGKYILVPLCGEDFSWESYMN